MMKFKNVFFRPHSNEVVCNWSPDLIDHFELLDYNGIHIKVFFKDQTTQTIDTELDWYIEGIEVDEHYGSWYIIDCIMIDHKLYLLCEHEEYGDETANIIIDLDGNLILDEVWNGFEDLADHLDIELDI